MRATNRLTPVRTVRPTMVLCATTWLIATVKKDIARAPFPDAYTAKMTVAATGSKAGVTERAIMTAMATNTVIATMIAVVTAINVMTTEAKKRQSLFRDGDVFFFRRNVFGRERKISDDDQKQHYHGFHDVVGHLATATRRPPVEPVCRTERLFSCHHITPVTANSRNRHLFRFKRSGCRF